MLIKSILLVLLLALAVPARSQNTRRAFFDEAGLSINRTNVENDNTENRFGFGLSAYHLARKGKKLNLVFGFEYNHTRQFKKSMYGGRYYSYSHITYSLNSLSIPVSARLNLGNFFLEGGGFAEFYVAAKRQGTTTAYTPGQGYEVSKFEDVADIAPLNYGPALALGFRVLVFSHEVMVKTTYRQGRRNLYTYNRSEIFNQYFQVLVGIRL